MSNFIDFQGHSTVIGLTRSGKTWATKQSLARRKEGVIFFNIQLEDMPKPFVEANCKNSLGQIVAAIKKGKKINYLPQRNNEMRELELIALINICYDAGFTQKKNIFFAVDEVHLYKKAALDKLEEIATTGLRFGVNGIFISQRPANISNTLMTQSSQMVIFKTNMESTYFQRYSMPADLIQDRLSKAGEYSYLVWNWQELSQAKKVSI